MAIESVALNLPTATFEDNKVKVSKETREVDVKVGDPIYVTYTARNGHGDVIEEYTLKRINKKAIVLVSPNGYDYKVELNNRLHIRQGGTWGYSKDFVLVERDTYNEYRKNRYAHRVLRHLSGEIGGSNEISLDQKLSELEQSIAILQENGILKLGDQK